MTKQQVINKLYQYYIVEKNKPGVEPVEEPLKCGYTVACKYRSSSGGRCAAGVFIPDDKYHKNMEGICITSIINTDYPELMEFFTIEGLYPDGISKFISSMQKIHDEACKKSDNELYSYKFYEDFRGFFSQGLEDYCSYSKRNLVYPGDK